MNAARGAPACGSDAATAAMPRGMTAARALHRLRIRAHAATAAAAPLFAAARAAYAVPCVAARRAL